MKKLLLICLVLCHTLTHAQGPQLLVNVDYDSWPGATVPGWIYLPADYGTTTKEYPVVFFYHGVGEAGTNPYTLLNQGLPNLIANGMRPDNIINPVDGKSYSFIVLSVQHWSWSPNPNWLPYEVQWLKRNYRIDTNRLYVTGLSAGGQSTFNAIVNNTTTSRMIAAAVPMSPAGVGAYDATLVNTNKIETWFFAGNADGSYTANATQYYSDCNLQYPGSSHLNLYSGGHCCWNTFYNTAWHDPVTSLSVWEWMLSNQKAIIAAPLPVNFISLDLKKENGGARITWKVSEEENVERYEVEKSTDAHVFHTIGVVMADSKTQYEYFEKQVINRNYFRVKSVDHDGKYKYSSILSVNNNSGKVLLKAFPIPATNDLTLQHPTAETSSRILVHASDGRLLQTIIPKQQTQQTLIDCSQMLPGAYFIQYETGGDKTTLLITKAK